MTPVVSNNRQTRIAELLRLASADKALDRRLANLEALVAIRGGLGKQTKRAVRMLLHSIQQTVDGLLEREEIDEVAYRNLTRQIEAVHERLAETSYARRIRLQRKKAEKEIFETKVAETKACPPKPPFPIPFEHVGGFKWRYRVLKNGELEWQMAQI